MLKKKVIHLVEEQWKPAFPFDEIQWAGIEQYKLWSDNAEQTSSARPQQKVVMVDTAPQNCITDYRDWSTRLFWPKLESAHFLIISCFNLFT